MKKFTNVLAVLLALVMCLGVVVACATDDAQGNDDATTTTAPGTTKAPTTTKAPDTTTAEETTTAGPTLIETPTVDVPADGIITTAEQLHAVLVNGKADQNYTVNATELDMSKYAWTGLVGYTGTFDFAGCKLTGCTDSLFISVLGGTVKNLVLANSTYSYLDDEAKEDINPESGAAGNLYFSPVVRYAKDITIENVTVESDVKVKSDIWTNNSNHGGIIAAATGSNVLIKNCHFKGEYETDSTQVRIGGVAGFVNSSAATSVNVEAPELSTCLVVNCTNSGLVKNLGFGQDSKAAAVVGYLGNAAVVRCANYGTMDSNDAGQTGGVVGYVGNTTAMKDCLNVGSVKGASFVGGICAYSNGSARYFYNCINLGKIENTANDNRGGIIGLAKSKEVVTNCFNLKTTSDMFINNKNNVAVDPADPATQLELVLTNCGNLDTVDAIFAAIEAAVPGVFEKVDGSLKVIPLA